ncbi:DNA polymerase [Bacterioplanes sanyensis]|uniref:DNA polymerase II n=1 Tax=Bacterioplanes sanyensis TaxID=1249553 RepID=UPI00167404A5|nr:DNA polymerase II [Bacterioplanes sanyensis]GGY38864.1 DNA polymerase [Bacterioplanes sanyensis]
MPQPTPAFLLTTEWHDTPEGTELIFWWSTPEGPMCTRHSQPGVCFIDSEHAERASAIADTLGWPITIKALQLKSFALQPASACYMPAGYLYRWRDVLADQGIVCREVDIRPTDRYLMERFIYGAAELHTQGTEVRLAPARYVPNLHCLSLDIETSMPRRDEQQRLFSIAVYSDRDQRIFTCAKPATEMHSELTIEWLADEAALLQRFIDYVQHSDPDVLMGWNLVQFDVEFLRNKAKQLGIELRLGRNGEVLNWRRSRTHPERVFIHMAGRLALDGIELLRNATWQFESFALNDVAAELLGEGKLLHGEQRGDDIERLFETDPIALARYNLKDCELVWRIFEHADLLNFTIERAHMTGLAPDRMGGSVAAFENLYLPRLHRAGFVAPNIGEGYHQRKSPGGLVMDSRPGLHEHVLVLDFKSLYPSIIRSFNIDPMGLVLGLQAQAQEAFAGELTVPGFFDGVFHKQQHLLPELIGQLGRYRDQAKREGNQPLAQAIKIIMASCYGVLGSDGCRFYDTRLSSSITMRGHEIIRRSAAWIDAQGHQVIYGDTDSVFVAIQAPASAQAAHQLGRQLAQQLNDYWRRQLQREFGTQSFLEMEFETYYRRFFMPSIRGEEVGSKKRYAGLAADAEGHSELVVKGLEAVRSDWTPLARNFQRELLRRLFAGEAYQSWLRQTVEQLLTGQLDAQLVYRKRLRRPLSAYQRQIPPHARAAQKLEQWLLQQNQPARFAQRGGWIQYRMTVNGPEPVEHSPSALDYQHYLEKQLQPIADAILHFTGEEFATLAGQQLRLF